MGRRPRYRRTDLHGILVIDKALEWTSNDVVQKVRRLAGDCKTGHAGTLDPLATGILVCCLGKATSAVETIMTLPKTYTCVIDLRAFSTTDDAEGDVTEVSVEQPPTPDAIRAVLDDLTGTIEQRPPAYSAMKVDGRPAYQLARAGAAVSLPARPVRIDAITVDGYAWPTLELTIRCGRGTYIRSLARQIGEALGTGGYLTRLRRTAVGPYGEPEARTLDAVPQPLLAEHLLQPPSGAP